MFMDKPQWRSPWLSPVALRLWTSIFDRLYFTADQATAVMEKMNPGKTWMKDMKDWIVKPCKNCQSFMPQNSHQVCSWEERSVFITKLMNAWNNFLAFPLNNSFNLKSAHLSMTSIYAIRLTTIFRDGNYRLSACPGQVKLVSDITLRTGRFFFILFRRTGRKNS